MHTAERKYRIFISAAEPSGDILSADLITALKQTTYDIEFVGVGGPKMAEAGCELLQVTTGKPAMIYNAFVQVAHYCKLIKRVSSFIKSNNIDLVIVCDSPAFNFHVAKAAKKARIKTVFYVAPQLWAWARWRIRKLRKSCDKLCCVLPFEQKWFGGKGLDAVFVGNPLLDDFHAGAMADKKKTYADFQPKNAKIALMPGSRTAEIETLWPAMQQIAISLKKKYKDATFTAVAFDNKTRAMLQSSQISDLECRYTISSVVETVSESDFAMVASGSATLQVAATGCPMVIMYQSSRILWHILGRWLVKAKRFSLVNILADSDLVPEFMPYFTSVEPIVHSIEQLFENKHKLAKISAELIELTRPLAEGKAANKVAQIVTGMLD